MALFLGYDPGGRGTHGVVSAEIDSNGRFLSKPQGETKLNAGHVRDWVRRKPSAVAIGIDTLLAWSPSGRRACDDVLREKYPDHGNTVIAQNSLYSSMTINGILVAKTAHKLGIRLVESHPKLLLKTELQCTPEGAALAKRHCEMQDDIGDALIAAWTASRWWFGQWPSDLYDRCRSDLEFPEGEPVYPWPRCIDIQ
jgi:hypothetical protein